MIRATEPLVGRVAELAAVDRAVAALAQGEAGGLVISGEPGIGKTRLLGQVAERADERGFVVLTGSASELERDLPFWIFVDALDDYVAGLDPRRLAVLGDDGLGELAQLMPALGEHRGAGGPVLRDERYRAHRAARELLECLAAARPLALVLDDVHWADAASVELLAALLRRPPAAPVLLALATRPRQVPDRLAAAIERADRDGALTHVGLDGLDREEAASLLGGDVAAARADALFEETGGNPFYLEQLARSPGATATATRGTPVAASALDAVGVPAAVVASLAEELDLLSASTRRLLQGAAAAGDPFELELAAAAAGIDEPVALDAFDELLSLGLARATEIPRRFRFRHPLVRRAVYEAAPTAWLLGAHERCAQALAERGASAAARAHHVEQSARHGDAAALAVLKEAGASAILRAPASTERWFSAALRLLPEDAPPQERIELLLPRAGALAALGRLDESHADLLESITVAPQDGGLRVQLITACAGVEHLLGRHRDAHARLQAALDELPDTAAADAVALMLELAKDALFGRRWESLRDWAERALQAARELGNRPLIAGCLALLTLGRAMAGHTAEAQAARSEAAALIAAMPDAELSARVEALAFLGQADLYLERYDDALAHATRADALGRATGSVHPLVVPTMGTALFMVGRLAEASVVLDAGVESSRLVGVSQGIAWSLHNRSYLAWLSGDVAEGLAMAQEAVQRAERLDDSIVSTMAGMALALLSLPGGSSDHAVATFLRAAGGEELASLPGMWRVMGLDILARSQLALGRRDDATRAAARAEQQAAALGLSMAAAWAHRATAAVTLDADPAAAAGHALASAQAAERVGAVVEAALSHSLAGRALAQAGAPDDAARVFERAAAVFAACGAERHRDAAEQELRRLGRTVHRRSRPAASDARGVASLTGREREIAELVVDRRTNPEIAAALFLSLKTVETHLRNIFRKLGVSSRVELARAVERAANPR